VTVKSNSSVTDVLRILAENSILSAPVMDAESVAPKCLGFVDVLDIESLAVKIMKDSNQELHEFFSNPFFEKKITAAMSHTPLDEWVPIEASSSLLDVLCAFTSQPLFRPHRLPVLNSDGNIIGIISQSDIIKVAAKSKHLLGNCKHKTIEDMGLEHAVIAARSNVTARDVLGLLAENRVHGVAVVEHPTSKLLANLSASDLRGMTRHDLALFDKPVMEFLDAIHSKRGSSVKAPITCPPHTELGQVLTLLAENNIHRIFVTDGDNHTIGVISMGDVLDALKNV